MSSTYESRTYKIKDVAQHSGFTAATLRYYEEIGLLPEPTRSSAGYRLYDNHTLDRLAFISRTKQLGCSLKEIGDLTLAWDGGECGPVQDSLRSLVADKLLSAQHQIAQLATLTNELQRAATLLEQHRPDGPCDERCGCVSDVSASNNKTQTNETQTNEIQANETQTGEASPSQVVTLGKKPAAFNDSVAVADSEIVCTLATPSIDDRLAQWQQLLSHVVLREPLDDGLRATFGPATPLDELMRLVNAEQDCCQFFAFAITVDSRGLALEIRGPADALPIVNSLFGAQA